MKRFPTMYIVDLVVLYSVLAILGFELAVLVGIGMILAEIALMREFDK